MTKEPSRIRLKLKALDPGWQRLVDIVACIEVARAGALPLKDRATYLTDFCNRLEMTSRKAQRKHVRDFAQAFSVRLMEMGH